MGRVSLLPLALAMSLVAISQPVGAREPATFDVTLEPVRATVGDRLTLTIAARHAPDARLELPSDADEFAPLELIEVRPAETREIADGLQETRVVYVVAAFRTGEVQPPNLRVAVLGEEGLVTTVRPPAVTIESVLSDEEPGEFRDLKGPLRVAAGGPPSWLWAALFMAGFAGVSVFTVLLAGVPASRIPQPVAAPKRANELAEEAARRELDAIAAAGHLDRAELSEYYRRIADCLRRFLSKRFNVPAVAMTSQELEGRLEALGVERWPVRLAANLLGQCEAVEFAGYEPARERAESDLSTAYEVVSLTARNQETSVRAEGESA